MATRFGSRPGPAPAPHRRTPSTNAATPAVTAPATRMLRAESRGSELGRGAEPVRRTLRQGCRDGRINPRWDRLPQPPHRRHRIGEPLRDHHLRARPRVGRLAYEHLVQHTAETVHVTPPVERPTPARLLGAHIRRRPHRNSRFRQLAAGRLRDRPRDPEIAYYRVPRLEQNVLWLDVAVHYVAAVGVAQGVRHFLDDLYGL